MGNALELYDALSAFKLKETAVKSIDDSKAYYLDLNKFQLKQGKDAKGKQMPGYLSRTYAAMKAKMNPLARGAVDLFLTGKFQNSFKVKVEGDDINIEADDPNNLEQRYGQTNPFFGLDDKGQTEYNKEYFLPEFQQRFTDATGLQFK